LYILVEIKWAGTKWAHLLFSPLNWLGMNAFIIFVTMELFYTALFYNIKVQYNGAMTPVWLWIYWNLFDVWIASEEFASLFVSLIWLCFYTLFAFLLYRKRWFITL